MGGQNPDFLWLRAWCKWLGRDDMLRGKCKALLLSIALLSAAMTASGSQQWPPPVKPSDLLQGDAALAKAHSSSLLGDLDGALRALRAGRESVEQLLALAHVQCTLGDTAAGTATAHRALALRDADYAADGDTPLESALRGREGCAPLPLLFSSSTVAVDGPAEGGTGWERVYVLDREDEEGTLVVRQVAGLGAAREGFVLRELMQAPRPPTRPPTHPLTPTQR